MYLKVDPPFVWSETLSPIALPPADIETPDNLVLTTSGWGKTYVSNFIKSFVSTETSFLLYFIGRPIPCSVNES